MAVIFLAKEAVFFVGGTGSQTSVASPGGVTKVRYDAIVAGGTPGVFDASLVMDTNGEALATAGPASTVTDSGGDPLRITAATPGDFTDVTVGLVAFVNFAATYTVGQYEVLDTDGADWIEVRAEAYSADTTANVNVGGAYQNLQDALDDVDGANFNMFIQTNLNETITSTILEDANSGTTSTRRSITGYNSTFTTEAEVTITATTAVGDLLLLTAGDYTTWKLIDFDGGDGATDADYCVRAVAAADGQNAVFEQCKMHNATLDGVQMRSNQLGLINCEIYDNGADGFDSVGSASSMSISECSIHNNGTNGIRGRFSVSSIMNNLIYDNTQDGINFNALGAAANTIVTGNTIFSNTQDGIEHDPADAGLIVYNNCLVDNGGFGENLNGMGVGDFRYFGFNLAAQNTTAAISGGHDFATFGNGSNQDSSQTNEQLFVDATGSHPDLDFTPESGSELINNGFQNTGATAGTGTMDIGAVQEASGGGGGGILIHTGMNGGIRG